jgi:rare lipoprotein A
VNVAVTVALLPALFVGHGEDRGRVIVRAAATDTVPVVATVPTTQAPAPTTSTTVPVARRAAPSTTVAPRVPVRRAAATTATTTAPRVVAKPRPTTTTTTAPKPSNTESGKASYYDYQAGICAHKTLPMGTVVNVTNLANGKSVACKVGDRGPFVDGWIIDLNPREFDQIASRSAGVISVRISW